MAVLNTNVGRRTRVSARGRPLRSRRCGCRYDSMLALRCWCGRLVDRSADDEDVSDLLIGDASVTDNVITLPQVAGLAAGHHYRLRVQFDVGEDTFGAYVPIWAEEA